jgi:hypothetical protein
MLQEECVQEVKPQKINLGYNITLRVFLTCTKDKRNVSEFLELEVLLFRLMLEISIIILLLLDELVITFSI